MREGKTMIITKTLTENVLFRRRNGFSEFYCEHGGAVLSTTFDKFCYVHVRHLPRFFNYSSELIHSEIEQVSNLKDIRHPLIREAMKYLDMHERSACPMRWICRHAPVWGRAAPLLSDC